MKRFIRLDEENRVCAVRYGREKVDGEVESDRGNLGELRRKDGSFEPKKVEQLLPTKSFEHVVLDNLQEITRVLMLLKEGLLK